MSPSTWFVGHGSNLCGWRCPLSASGGVCLCTVINAAQQPGLQLWTWEQRGGRDAGGGGGRGLDASRYTNNDSHSGVGTNSGRSPSSMTLARSLACGQTRNCGLFLIKPIRTARERGPLPTELPTKIVVSLARTTKSIGKGGV